MRAPEYPPNQTDLCEKSHRIATSVVLEFTHFSVVNSVFWLRSAVWRMSRRPAFSGPDLPQPLQLATLSVLEGAVLLQFSPPHRNILLQFRISLSTPATTIEFLPPPHRRAKSIETTSTLPCPNT